LPEKPHSAFGQETLNANGSNGTKADETPVSIPRVECVGSLHKPLGNVINPRKLRGRAVCVPQDNRREVYMEVSDELALLALDIAERGVRQPIPITQESAVVSGHRRLTAARLAGIGEVPCVVQDDADDAEMAVEMARDNAPRKRPFTQLMAHALVLKEIVEPILAARKRHQDPSDLPGYASIAPIIEMMTRGSVTNVTEGSSVKNFTEGGSVKNSTQLHWEDIVGRLIGMGGRTLRWGLEVYLAAIDGDELAADLCVKLDEGELTVSGAHKAFKAGRKPSAGGDYVVLRRCGDMRSRLDHAAGIRCSHRPSSHHSWQAPLEVNREDTGTRRARTQACDRFACL
jgi:hypothetical protein